MPRYAVFGSCLESAVEFPELPRSEATSPRWRFALADKLPPMVNARELGADLIYDDVHARLFAHEHGTRIRVDDTGDFEISPDGSIVALPLPGAWDDFVRAHLLGRVLATALYAEGYLPLHGSAVATAEGVVAFLAPKGFGKSSLALALAQLDAPLVTDDTLPIEPTTPPRAWPGVHSVRVNEDTLTALQFDPGGQLTREGKVALHAHDAVRVAERPLPLAAIFLLAPIAESERTEPVVRTPFVPALGAAAIVAHVKIGAMLGRDAAAVMLSRASVIANLIPVHQLSITRDLSRLPDAARTILEWYGGPAK